MRLEGKVAIVTGAAQGIGRAIASLFADEGARVLIADIQEEKGEATAQEIRARGREASFLRTDVGIAADVKRMVDTAVERYGRLDILVNNAYWSRRARVTELDEEVWDRAIAVCLKAMYLGAKYAIPEMLKVGGGSIINISSVHAFTSYPTSVVYDAAKGGVSALTRVLAVEWGRHGIRVNAICPGMIVTEVAEASFFANPEHARLRESIYPIGRVGRPIDIAKAALFLASDDASYVLGHNLVVDGGFLAASIEAVADPLIRRLLGEESDPTKEP
jgi:NAD(P)-dependent dehydrogenase (short-subunit alcohol dehydrogenase family)